MSFNFSQSLGLEEDGNPELADYDYDFDSELPGYYEDRARSRPVTKSVRSRGRGRGRGRLRGTLPLPYPGQGIRNKYSIAAPVQNVAREEQILQKVSQVKEKLEVLEKKSSDLLTERMAFLVEVAVQELERNKSAQIDPEKQLGLIRGLQQRLDHSDQDHSDQGYVSQSSQDMEQKYKELEEMDKLAKEYKTAINTKQEDISQRITKLLSVFKSSKDIEP